MNAEILNIPKLSDDENCLLQEAIACGKITTDVFETINTMRKEKVLSVHPFAISMQASKGLYYKSYIKPDSGMKARITATTEAGLFKKLYKLYFEDQAMTLDRLYPEWIERRESIGVSPRTVHRNRNHWDKYYRDNPIVSIPLSRLTDERIEDFFHQCIKKYSLTVKELGNMKYVMKDMLKLAKKKKYIEHNPFIDVDISLNGCRPTKRQNDTSRVYLDDEKNKMFDALNREIKANPNCTDMYAIHLLFRLGLRIGELVALKWEDIDYTAKEIHIHRMETKTENDFLKEVPVIAEYTKKKSPYGDRFLPLDDYDLSLFDRVKSINKRNGYEEGDFIFCDEKGRTKTREIDNRIRKCCRMAGIEIKSAHDIRRTVASEMYANGVSVEIIRYFLGHSDIKTTYGYIMDNKKKEDRNQLIHNSLLSMRGMDALLKAE